MVLVCALQVMPMHMRIYGTTLQVMPSSCAQSVSLLTTHRSSSISASTCNQAIAPQMRRPPSYFLIHTSYFILHTSYFILHTFTSYFILSTIYR